MLELVRDCVARFLASEGGATRVPGRSVYLDASNGAVDGSCFLFFDESGQTPVLVAKAARTPEGRAIYRVEFETLEALESHGLNERQRTTPAPLGVWEEQGALITLQSALPGTLMKNLKGKELFSAERAAVTVDAVETWWTMFVERCGVQRERFSPQAYERVILTPVERFRRRFRMEDSQQHLLDRFYHDDSKLEGIDLPLMVRHGDFCTANMVLEQERVGVFDWEFPLDARLPLMDLFYFFSSLRYPYQGVRGESTHLDSFSAVYYEPGPLQRLLTESLHKACVQFDLPTDRLGVLLLFALIEVANMKYDALLEASGSAQDGLASGDPTDSQKHDFWQLIGPAGEDVPFASIVEGVALNVKLVADRGLPELG